MEKTHINKDFLAVKKLQQNDIDAFDSLFKEYSKRLYKFSLKYLKNEEDAEEVVQDVFLYIWQNRKKLKPESSFNAYVFTIAFNIIKKHFNKLALDNAYKSEIITTLFEEENKLDQIIDYKGLLKKVETLIESMPERRKEIFLKRKYEGLPVKKIAEQMGISPNTVENQLSTAQKFILNELKNNQLAGILFFMLFVSE